MFVTKSHLNCALGLALIAGMAVLAGCGPTPTPVTSTTTTTERVTTRPLLPPPAASTTTTETQEFHNQ